MNVPRSALLASTFALTLALAPPTRADAVPSPPKDCPPGARGETNHMGPYCGPAECKSNEECNSGQKCVFYPLCVHRWTNHSPRGNSYTAQVKGPCKEGQCDQGDACESKPHCVPSGTPTASSDTKSGKSCAIAPSTRAPDGASMGGLALLVAAMVARRARR